jgi:hypothetical protein
VRGHPVRVARVGQRLRRRAAARVDAGQA